MNNKQLKHPQSWPKQKLRVTNMDKHSRHFPHLPADMDMLA